MSKPFAIYADIGGTHSRFAVQLTENTEHEQVRIYSSTDFNSPTEIILKYISDQCLEKPKHITIAIACPITGDLLKMANLHWVFSITETKKAIGVDSLHFINDFEALVLSLPHLKDHEKVQAGSESTLKNGTIALIGPGTGVGVAHLVYTANGYQAIPCEGGHALYPPQDSEEIEIMKVLMVAHPIVTIEHLLSGSRGIHNLMQSMAIVHHKSIPNWSVPELFTQGLIHKIPFAIEILNRYCAMLGNVTGNIALNIGAKGGIYIGGGIVPRLGDFFIRSRFRECFENKDLATYYVKTMPTFVIKAPYPAILGAKYALKSLLTH